MPSKMPRVKGFRFPREIIAYAVWVYHRFALSAADFEDLLSERGLMVSRATIWQCVNRFGSYFANCIRRDRSTAADKSLAFCCIHSGVKLNYLLFQMFERVAKITLREA